MGVEEEVQWLTLKNRSFLLKNRAFASHSRATEQIHTKVPSFLAFPSHQNRLLPSSLRKRWALFFFFSPYFFFPFSLFGFFTFIPSHFFLTQGEVIVRARLGGYSGVSYASLSIERGPFLLKVARESLMLLRNERVRDFTNESLRACVRVVAPCPRFWPPAPSPAQPSPLKKKKKKEKKRKKRKRKKIAK